MHFICVFTSCILCLLFRFFFVSFFDDIPVSTDHELDRSEKLMPSASCLQSGVVSPRARPTTLHSSKSPLTIYVTLALSWSLLRSFQLYFILPKQARRPD